MYNVFMELKLIYGRTYFESIEKVVDELKSNYDKNKKYLFVVPDRFTLFAEKYIMERLNLVSTFNIDVMTLNNIAGRNAMINDYVDNETATMILSKVIYSIRDELKVFKLTSNSFCSEMYAIIQQIKSSQISSDEFANAEYSGSDYEKLKKQDIAKIYTEYEKYLNVTGVDSVKKFEIFIEQIKNIDLIKSSYIYFAGFESFTSQGYQIIENFVRYSKGVCVASVNYIEQPNKDLYPCDISYEIKKIASNLQIECKIDNQKINILNTDIIENLWAVKYSKGNDIVFVNKTESRELQNKNIASFIAKKVMKENARFKDFNVILNSENDELLSIFDDYKIEYFSDKSQSLSDFIVIKFIRQVNECVLKRFDTISFIEYSKSPFVDGTWEQKNELENFAEKYSVRGADFYREKDIFKNVDGYKDFLNYSSSIAENIITYKNEFKMTSKISDFVSGTKTLLKIFDLKNKFDIMLENYKDENRQIQYMYGKKVFERLDTLLANLDRVLGDTVVSFKEFVTIFDAGLSGSQISIVPQSVDAVYVGDINSSFFAKRKYTLFVDCNENTMPTLLKDNGIFSDDDIDNSKTKNKINPKIKLLNKKKKIKILSLLSLGENYLFFETDKDKEPSRIISDLKKVCNVNILDMNGDNSFAVGKNSLLEYLAFNSDKLNFEDAVFDNTLYKNILSDLTFKNYRQRTLSGDYSEIFFLNNTFSVSQIETFYKCPYRHFIDFGLRLKTNEKSDLNALSIGNIIHDCLDEIVKKYNTKILDDRMFCDKIFDKVISEEKYIKYKGNPRHKNILEGVKNELFNHYNVIKNQFNNSELANHYTEKAFNQRLSEIMLKYINKKYSDNIGFYGKIDRIDYDEDSFIVVDYKTGTADIGYSDIYYGNKIQIIAYAAAYEILSGKKCIGMFYMPVKNFYKKDENDFKKTLLRGLYLKDSELMSKVDSKITKYYRGEDLNHILHSGKSDFESDILNLKIDDVESVISDNNENVNEYQMEYIKKYVFNLIDMALSEIKRGNIDISPVKNGDASSCDICSYKGICKISDDTLFRYKTTISKKTFFGEEDEDNVIE